MTTKLYVPRLRTDLVTRPRLLGRLGQAVRGLVTLVAAPAGWGKTTLLAAWHTDPAREPWPVSWVSLDAGDNDPVRFWTYVLAALNQAHPGVADAALAVLRASQPPALDAALTLLVNALADLPTDVVLVLDDYHLITAEPIHTTLAALLDHMPPRLHLMLATREDPQLPLARLRVRGALSELRAADLRFTSDEAASFLRQATELPLRAEAVVALQIRTEGWIAGLQLAALSLQGRPGEGIDDFIRAFTGSNRYIVDYLIEEVLTRQSPAVQTFLLRTAVLDRFCAPLCERLLSDADLADRPTASRPTGPSGASGGTASAPRPPAAQATLEQMERANLFLVPLDEERHWYRYHHLFADVLRSRLRRLEPELPAMLHQRASAWFEEQSLVVEAIDQALAARDVECAARLIERDVFASGTIGVDGQVQTVLGWLRALPAALVRSRPSLCACEAIMLFLSGHAVEVVEARLDEAEAAVAASIRAGAAEPELRPIVGILAHIRALVALMPGDLPRSVALAREALTLLPESEVDWRATARYFASRSYLLTGDMGATVEHTLANEMATLRATGNLVVALASGADLAYLHMLRGRLRVAADTYQEALHAIPAPVQLEDLLTGPAFCFGLGEVLLEWNDLEGADHLLTRGMRMLERGSSPAHALTKGYVVLARLRQARGEGAEALEALDAFTELADRRHFTPELRALGAATRARVHLAQGDLTTAVRWADGAGLSADDAELPFPREREYLTLARVRIAQGRTTPSSPHLDEALRLLERLERAAAAQGRGDSVLEIQILRALALQAQGRQAAALAALARALLLAEPEGYVRLFADEGQPMAGLLSRLLTAIRQGRLAARDTTAGYLRTLQDACGGLHPAATDVDKAFADLPVPATSSQSPAAPATPVGGSMTHSMAGSRPQPQQTPLVTPLTAREVEVLRLLAEGAANADIARLLVLTVGTVKAHVYNICGKLGVRTRAQAVARARALHLL